jgi:hypothetical protein
VEQEEAAAARQWHGKHASAATDSNAKPEPPQGDGGHKKDLHREIVNTKKDLHWEVVDIKKAFHKELNLMIQRTLVEIETLRILVETIQRELRNRLAKSKPNLNAHLAEEQQSA